MVLFMLYWEARTLPPSGYIVLYATLLLADFFCLVFPENMTLYIVYSSSAESCQVTYIFMSLCPNTDFVDDNRKKGAVHPTYYTLVHLATRRRGGKARNTRCAIHADWRQKSLHILKGTSIKQEGNAG